MIVGKHSGPEEVRSFGAVFYLRAGVEPERRVRQALEAAEIAADQTPQLGSGGVKPLPARIIIM